MTDKDRIVKYKPDGPVFQLLSYPYWQEMVVEPDHTYFFQERNRGNNNMIGDGMLHRGYAYRLMGISATITKASEEDSKLLLGAMEDADEAIGGAYVELRISSMPYFNIPLACIHYRGITTKDLNQIYESFNEKMKTEVEGGTYHEAKEYTLIPAINNCYPLALGCSKEGYELYIPSNQDFGVRVHTGVKLTGRPRLLIVLHGVMEAPID